MCPLLGLCILTVPREGESVSPHAEARTQGKEEVQIWGATLLLLGEEGKHSLSYHGALAGHQDFHSPYYLLVVLCFLI